MSNVWMSFFQSAVIAVIFGGLAVLGIFTGKKLRDNKNAKEGK